MAGGVAANVLPTTSTASARRGSITPGTRARGVTTPAAAAATRRDFSAAVAGAQPAAAGMTPRA